MDIGSMVLFVLKATVWLVAGLALSATLRRAPAGARYLVWLSTLAGIVLLPALLVYSPAQIEVIPRTLLVPGGPLAASPSSVGIAPPRSLSSAPSARPASIASVTGPATAALPGPTKAMAWPSPTRMLLALWALVALAQLAWLLAGVLAVRRILRSARPVADPQWRALLCEVADRIGLDELPQLLLSDRVEMPFATGALRATVVLPAGSADWTEERRRLVLFHELAHVRRRDLLGHALSRLACAAYWFHPLVWTAAKRLRAESERACDDLVLDCGARASDYADHLLDILSAARQQGAPASALPMARRKEFEGRLLAILDPALKRGALGRAKSVVLLAGLATVFFVVAATAPARAVSPLVVPVSPAASETSAVLPLADAAPPPAVVPLSNGSERPARTTFVRTEIAQVEEKKERVEVRRRHRSDDEAEPAEASDEEGDKPHPIDAGRRATLIRLAKSDSDAAVRRSAVWALAQTPEPDATESLATALRGDADAEVREMAAWALANGRRGDTSAALGAAMRDGSPEVRATAAWALGQRRQAATAALVAALGDSSARVREVAIWALGNQRLDKAPAPISASLRDAEAEVRLVAAWALGEIQDPATAATLRAAFDSEKDEEVRRALFRALAMLGGEASADLFERALQSKDRELRVRAVQMLGGHSGAWPWPWPRPEPRPFP